MICLKRFKKKYTAEDFVLFSWHVTESRIEIRQNDLWDYSSSCSRQRLPCGKSCRLRTFPRPQATVVQLSVLILNTHTHTHILTNTQRPLPTYQQILLTEPQHSTPHIKTYRGHPGTDFPHLHVVKFAVKQNTRPTNARSNAHKGRSKQSRCGGWRGREKKNTTQKTAFNWAVLGRNSRRWWSGEANLLARNTGQILGP